MLVNVSAKLKRHSKIFTYINYKLDIFCIYIFSTNTQMKEMSIGIYP